MDTNSLKKIKILFKDHIKNSDLEIDDMMIDELNDIFYKHFLKNIKNCQPNNKKERNDDLKAELKIVLNKYRKIVENS